MLALISEGAGDGANLTEGNDSVKTAPGGACARITDMIGVGIDIIEIERVRAALERHGDRFLRHVFLEGEVAYCSSRRKPESHYAARFAAKEAVVKALAVKKGMRFLWRDIEVRRNPDGAPSITLSGRAREMAAQRAIRDIHVSLSHSDTHAVALATAT